MFSQLVAAVGEGGLDAEGGEDDACRLIDERGVGNRLFPGEFDLFRSVASFFDRAGLDDSFMGGELLALGMGAPGAVGLAVEVVQTEDGEVALGDERIGFDRVGGDEFFEVDGEAGEMPGDGVISVPELPILETQLRNDFFHTYVMEKHLRNGLEQERVHFFTTKAPKQEGKKGGNHVRSGHNSSLEKWWRHFVRYFVNFFCLFFRDGVPRKKAEKHGEIREYYEPDAALREMFLGSAGNA